MIKVGDKVKFDTYIPKNYLSNHYLKKTLKGERILVKNYTVKWSESLVHYNTPLIRDDERDGIFVGWFKKKLKRSYQRTGRYELELSIDPFGTDRLVVTSPRRAVVTRVDRYSEDPARLDNPRKLDKIAMIKYKNMLLGVPVGSLYRCTYKESIKIL